MEQMVAAYPELAYVDPPSGQTHYGLFHTGFEGPAGDKRWVSGWACPAYQPRSPH